MELRLEQLIGDLERVSNVRNLDTNNPIVLRFSHPTNATVHVIVCALEEPDNLILPLNVTWFNFDPQSSFYRTALRRLNKDVDPVNAGLDNTWELVETWDEVFVAQVYDTADQAALQDDTAPVAAQPTIPGIARISVPAEVASNPIAVEENDPRLVDARVPLAHTHPEVPATQLQTSEGIVTISGSAAPVSGATLVANSANTAEWRQLNTSDIQ
jgi:hypothetical protein